MTPVSANCDTRYRADKDSGKRDIDVIKWIVMHDAEALDAEGVAKYFASENSKGSAHLVIDGDSCFRCLPNEYIPWAAPGANTKGFHIEMCGYARWDSDTWKDHNMTLERAAYKTAFHCKLFGIPPYFRWADQLSDGVPGVTTHAECTKAFGGNHTDPGDGWPRYYFMKLVREYYNALEV